MRRILVVLMIVASFVGCKGKSSPDSQVQALVFWHTQSDRNAKALREIVDEYNAGKPAIPVREEYVGDYDTLYRKTLAALLAKRPPDLAVAYESMVAEYLRYDAVVDLTAYFDAEPDDFKTDLFASFVKSGRFPSLDDKLMLMPFTKSILMMYYNVGMLEKVGKNSPPATWEEFLAVCREIKAKLNVRPYAFSRDASTFDGFVFSFGGDVYDPETHKPTFTSPPAVNTLKLLDTLSREKLMTEVAYGTYDDRNAFAQGQAAFFIRSSTSRPYVFQLADKTLRWDMAVIPRGKDAPQPATVLFGANICMFKSTDARQQAAWNFIKYFTSKAITARWGTATGYLPVRHSALETDTLKTFLAESPVNGRTFDAIQYAQSEPKVRGWQEVRGAIEKAMQDVITGRKTPAQAAKALQNDAKKCIAVD